MAGPSGCTWKTGLVKVGSRTFSSKGTFEPKSSDGLAYHSLKTIMSAMQDDYTIENEIADTSMNRPHIFLLGAGASKAAFPTGDKNGEPLPLMRELASIPQLSHLIEEEVEDFESYFSDISTNHPTKAKAIADELYIYFLKFELPDEPTLYDHLILSLRKKDVIATFNWDPLLHQAYQRCSQLTDKLPYLIFLHGNVAIGYCPTCNLKGTRYQKCRHCEKRLIPTKLLYPVKQKNYQDDFAKKEWDALQKYLQVGYILTIFGYSAPTTDVEAIALLKNGWGDKNLRDLEQIELIHNPRTKIEELEKRWEPFIHTHHYDGYDDFFKSQVMQHPRRSCEAMWQQLMECQFLDGNPAPKPQSLEELWKWYSILIDKE